MTRPRLRSTHRPLDRDARALQLGIGEDALVLDGLPPRLLDAVRRMDGASTLDELVAHVGRSGIDRRHLDGLLDALVIAGAVDADTPRHHTAVPLDQLDGLARHGLDGPTALARLARVHRATVAVIGHGDVGTHVRHAITTTGAHAYTHDDPAPPRTDAAVVLGRDVVDTALVDRITLAGTPVLPVVTTARGAVVGPWHAGPHTPCATCLDLRRTDADPAWPQLLTQLLRPGPDGLPRPADADPAVGALAGAVTAQWVRRHLVDLPESPGLTCEIDAWDLGTTHREWPVHPRCPGHDAPEEPWALPALTTTMGA